jgi:hypothetical protein
VAKYTGEGALNLMTQLPSTHTSSELGYDDPVRYEPMEPVVIRGQEFRMIGVTHTMPTFEEHRDELREAIRNAPYVFLEYFGKPMRDKAKPDTPYKAFWDHQTVDQESSNFYAAIGQICAEEGKDVIVVNPQTMDTNRIEAYLTVGLAAGLSVDMALDVIKDKLKTGKMSRRTFLKMALAAPAAMMYASYREATRSLRSFLEDKQIISSDLKPEEKAQIYSWYMQDWRDVRAATGYQAALERYAPENPQGQEIVAVNGAGHNGTLEYIKDPLTKSIKEKFYVHYDAWGDTSIRRFSFNRDASEWELREKVAY